MSVQDYVIMPGQDYKDICDAVRTKTGKTEILKSGDIPGEIESITGGGLEPKDVNFYDYDGTLLYSYTRDDYRDVQHNSLPPVPEPSTYLKQYIGWNKYHYGENSAGIDIPMSFGIECGYAFPGIRMEIEIHGWNVTAKVGFGVKGQASIDWGDNSGPVSVVTGTSLSTTVYSEHTYSEPGTYYIVIGRYTVDNEFDISITGTANTASYPNDNAKSNLFSLNYNDNTSVKEILIGDCVSKIGDYGLYNLSMVSIGIPETVSTIGKYAFGNCKNLKHVTIPRSIKTIDTYTFSNCYSLESVCISGSVTSIGANAFQNCYSLKQVALPTNTSSGSSIGAACFSSCSSLTKLSISKTYTNLNPSMLGDAKNLQELIIDCDNRNIDDYITAGNYALHTIRIIGSVTNIPGGFDGPSMTYLFDLSKITTIPTVNGGSFGCSGISNYKIYVPSNLYDEIIADQQWSYFEDHLVPI